MDAEALIRAVQQGDKDALAQFQLTYTPLVRYIISPILPNEADREECLSDVFLKAWQAIGSFDGSRGSLTTWLTTIARNTALNHRRSIVRREQDVPLNETIPHPDGSPEQAVLREEMRQAVRRAVSRLSRRERELFDRKYYYYQSTAQIAAELGMTVRGVEGRLYRIRKKLQQALGGVWHE